MPAPDPTYTIYLLTVWFDEAQINDPTQWRLRLENPRTKAVQGFVGLDALVAGLAEVVRRDRTRQGSSAAEG